VKIIITGRRFHVPEELARHVEGQFDRLVRFGPRVSHVEVVLSEEKNRCEAEAQVNVEGKGAVHGRAEARDFRTAVDRLAEKLAVQLKRKRSRPRDRRVDVGRTPAPPPSPSDETAEP